MSLSKIFMYPGFHVTRTSEKRQYENNFKVELKQSQKKMYHSGIMSGSSEISIYKVVQGSIQYIY